MSMLRDLIDVRSFKDSPTTEDIKRAVERATNQIYTLKQVAKMCTHAGLYPSKLKGKTVWLPNKRDKTDLVDHIRRLKADHKLTGFMTSKQIEKVTNMNIKSLWGAFRKIGIVNVGKGRRKPMWRIDVNSTCDDLTVLFKSFGDKPCPSATVLKLYNLNYPEINLKSLTARLSRHPHIQKHDTNPTTWSLL